jgi:protein-glucosylgalactosylhydroxylysine glucosidase
MRCALIVFIASFLSVHAISQKIDRKALVQRHNVKLNKADTLASLTVGNGSFAFTVDATGLQTFPKQ